MFDGVVEEVRQDLRDQVAVAKDLQAGGDPGLGDQALVLGQGVVEVPDLGGHGREVHRHKAAAGALVGLGAGDVAGADDAHAPCRTQRVVRP